MRDGASKAYFYLCPGCHLRFPSLERLSFCPRCGESLSLRSQRELGRDNFSRAHPLRPPCFGILENLRSAWNVGSIFRTADAAGFSHLYLCGITPYPPHEGISKTALGAENLVSWSYHPDAVQLLQELRAQGVILWALETEGSPWDPFSRPPSQPLALVVGNELSGIDPEVLELCHQTFSLPMRGGKNSLNVSVAFGVLALWTSAFR